MTYWITDTMRFLPGEPIWRIWIDDDDTRIESVPLAICRAALRAVEGKP